LITFGDLSSLLATSDRGGRDQVFSLLRRAYDGHVTRDIQPMGGADVDRQLEWSGRVTVVAAVTSVIDHYSAHADALGARWLYVRFHDRNLKSRQSAAKYARMTGVKDSRRNAVEMATDLIEKARNRVDEKSVPDHIADQIQNAILVTSYGRGAVPRSGYGKREVEGVAQIEDPPRLVRQTHVLARGMYALGLDNDQVESMTRRIALDSMPTARLKVLEVLAATPVALPTSKIAELSGLHWHVANRHAEDLSVIGVVDDLSGWDDWKDHKWQLRGKEGEIIREVISANSHET
jgi:hypothetical protein